MFFLRLLISDEYVNVGNKFCLHSPLLLDLCGKMAAQCV